MAPALAARVAAVRRFNRFYTRRLGLLHDALLGSDFSLAEMRVLWEITHGDGVTASQLGERLGMDAGYLSRVVRGFRDRGLVRVDVSKADGRVRHLGLTARGRDLMLGLERKSAAEVRAVIGTLSGPDQERLVASMGTIEWLLEARARDPRPWILRDPRPGDYGWVVQRHGALYAEEYGWDARFEALVAEIVAKFVRGFKPGRERCWIAERDGENVGSVFVVERSATVAQLRLLLVEPSARGLRIGSELVSQCVAFARGAGYRKMMLWTNDILHSARHIYERAGFRLVEEEKHESFGRKLTGQNWELSLLKN